MPKRRRYKKRKKNQYNIIAYLIIVGFIILIGFVLVSQSNSNDIYSFCEKLEKLNKSVNNDTELRNELKKLCGEELSQHDQELVNLSVDFLESLSNFNAVWKENESTAKEHAKKIDGIYSQIKTVSINSSKISSQVESLYRAELEKLDNELRIQRMEVKNVTFSITQLEEKNNSLAAELEKRIAEEKTRKDEEKKLSLIYDQRNNESKDLESNLSLSKSEYESIKNSFSAGLFPYVLIGIAFGGIIGFALCLKWKKEISYWDVYSSSAKVKSPLKLVALITGALLVTIIVYLFISGKLDAILAG